MVHKYGFFPYLNAAVVAAHIQSYCSNMAIENPSEEKCLYKHKLEYKFCPC